MKRKTFSLDAVQSNCNPQTPTKYKQNLVYSSRDIQLNTEETPNCYTESKHIS